MARDMVSLKMFTLTLTTAILGLLFSSCSFGSKNEYPRREAAYPIVPLFLQRASLYDLHRTLSSDELRPQLMQLFEAARWAPSEYNTQPWRFIYGLHGTLEWNKLFDTLAEGNKRWATNAGALILVLSSTKRENGKPAPTHSFDTGLAVAQLLLQATELNLVAHPIAGFDHSAVRQQFKIPADYTIEAMVVVGQQADGEHSQSAFAERDARTSSRRTIEEFAGEGRLP